MHPGINRHRVLEFQVHIWQGGCSSSNLTNRRRVAGIYTDYAAILNHWPVSLLPINKHSWRTTNLRHQATTRLLTSHGQWCLQYSSQVPAVYRKLAINKKEKKLRLIPPSHHLDFVSINILRPLQKADGENEYIFVMKDLYSKLTKAIPSEKTTATWVANDFMKHWVAKFVLRSAVLTKKAPVQFQVLLHVMQSDSHQVGNNYSVPTACQQMGQTMYCEHDYKT